MYCLGIDCGGTKNQLILYRQSGEVVFQNENQGITILLDDQLFIKNLLELFATIPQAYLNSIKNIQIGIAGWGSYALKETLYQNIYAIYPMFEGKLEVQTDVELVRKAYFGNDDGVIVLAGTGSVIYGHLQQKVIQIGGWGYLLGDEGSAYWIVKTYIIKLLADFDATQKLREDQATFLRHLNLKNTKELVGYFYSLERREVAQKCLILVDLAKEYPEVVEIFQLAGQQLANQLLTLHQRISLPFSVAFHGSVLLKNDYVKEALIKCLQDFPEIQPVQETISPCAACLKS